MKDKTRKLKICFMALMMLFMTSFTNNQMYANESTMEYGENDVGSYTIKSTVNEVRQQAEVKLLLEPSGEVEIQSITLPDETELKYESNRININVTENGEISFKIKYQVKEVKELKKENSISPEDDYKEQEKAEIEIPSKDENLDVIVTEKECNITYDVKGIETANVITDQEKQETIIQSEQKTKQSSVQRKENTATKYNMQLGADIISNPKIAESKTAPWIGDHLYFGNFHENAKGEIERPPLSWNVLENKAGGLTLLSEDHLFVERWNVDNIPGPTVLDYQNSRLRKELVNTYYPKIFPEIEKERGYLKENHIAESRSEFDIKEGNYVNPKYGKNYAVPGDLMYILSAGDYTNKSYGFWTKQIPDADELIESTRAKKADYYFDHQYNKSDSRPSTGDFNNSMTRSVAYSHKDGGMTSLDLTIVLEENGRLWLWNYFHVMEASIMDVRPAVTLDSSRVLFTSLAENGKPKDIIGEDVALPANVAESNQGYKDWIVTMLNTEQTLSVDNAKARVDSESITIPYSNATIGKNQYISAMITDKEGKKLLNYGKMVKTDTIDSGSVTITFPADFDRKAMNIYLISEQDNGDFQTSYASEPVIVPIHVATYDTMGGTMSEEHNITVQDGGKIPNLTPTFADHSFLGWYTSSTFEEHEKFDFNTPIHKDITLYAKWESNKEWVVSFESNGGTKVENAKVVSGEKVTKPKEPTKANNQFDGWYKDEELTDKWDFEINTVNSDMTLYAKWMINNPAVMVAIPTSLQLVNGADGDDAFASVVDVVKIIDNPKPEYPDKDIWIRASTQITLTNEKNSDTYLADVYKEDKTQYIDISTPLMILNGTKNDMKSKDFSLRTPVDKHKIGAHYTGIMNFIIEFRE